MGKRSDYERHGGFCPLLAVGTQAVAQLLSTSGSSSEIRVMIPTCGVTSEGNALERPARWEPLGLQPARGPGAVPASSVHTSFSPSRLGDGGLSQTTLCVTR